MVKSVCFDAICYDAICYNDPIIWRNSGIFSSLPILNRRTFLKGMGLAGAAGLLSACSGVSFPVHAAYYIPSGDSGLRKLNPFF